MSSHFDSELIKDFFDEFHELYEKIINTLVLLESEPSSEALINDLFRCIHTIKGNLNIVGFKKTASLVHALETSFDDVRHKRIDYDHSMSDIFLLSMDKIKISAECERDDFKLPFDTVAIENALIKIHIAKTDAERQRDIDDAISLLDPNTIIETLDAKDAVQKHNLDDQSTYKQDIHFFRTLIYPLEQRSKFWRGRTERLLEIADLMNEANGCTINPKQLEAAVLLHDLGMAFLPNYILNIENKLTERDFHFIHQHPVDAYLLLRRMSPNEEWFEAADICLQHHERIDGTGYPRGIKGNAIHDGAKILAIIDAYESITYTKALKENHKRPLMRAVMELHNCADTQFDRHWVGIFNKVIKKLHPTSNS